LGLDLDSDASPRVRTIAAGSLAADAGLAVGDEILSVGLGRADPDRLAEASGATRDGVALLVRRGDHTRWVVLGPHGRLDGDAPFGSNAEAATSHTL
ncbi:MAG: PDZ domain-containing protein, partial [Siculibacillus sp.]